MSDDDKYNEEIKETISKLVGDPDTDRPVIEAMSEGAKRAFMKQMDAVITIERNKYDADPTAAVVQVGEKVVKALKETITGFSVIVLLLNESKMRDRYIPAMGEGDYEALRSRIAAMGYTLTNIGTDLSYILYGRAPASSEGKTNG
jgi:hypothetical protein